MKIYRFKPKHQKNSLFIKVLIAVGIVQAALLLALGGMMVTQIIMPQEQKFEAPAPKEEVTPIKEERKARTREAQKRSNQMVKRINVAQVQNIATPDVSISLPSGMGGEGSGGGFGQMNMTGLNLDKMKFDLPSFELFGIKGKSDKVLIVFDVCSKSMTDEMGGLDAFNVVKKEIETLVRGLPSTALFNMMCFDTERWYENHPCAIDLFRSSLVTASEANKSAFQSWLKPFNLYVDKIGITEPNYMVRTNPIPYNTGFKYNRDVWQHHGVVGWYIAYQAAIEQGADVIFFLTTHWPKPEEYFVKMTDAQLKKFTEDTKSAAEKFQKAGGALVSSEEKEKYYTAAREAARRLIDKENEERKAKNIPLKVVRDSWGEAYSRGLPEAKEAVKRKTWDDLHPNFQFKTYKQGQLMAFYEPLLKKIYDDKALKRPTLNVIVMLPKKSNDWNKTYGSSVRSWAKVNGGGSVRILRGAKPVDEFK